MSRVLFSISYHIKPELRDRYLMLIRQMREHVAGERKKNYSVFEAKGKPNHFTEMFTLENMEEFDALDENQDEKTGELVSKVEECVDDKGMKYQTMIETA